jgi:tetratricopeptide (TPR) repeat protein
MKCSCVFAQRCIFVSLVLFFLCTASFAQKAPIQTPKPINIDRELEVQVTPNRAVSYYHYSLAKWYADRGDLTRSLSEMKIALKYNPDSAAIHLEMAVLLEKTGNAKEAIEHAKEAARLDPKDPDPHWFLANYYYGPQGRGGNSAEGIKDAIRELEQLKILVPEDERVYYALGGAYFENDEPEKAIEAYEKFQSLSSGTDFGYREIAKYYNRIGKPEKAIEYLNKGLEIQPDSAESLWILGDLYSKGGKNKEAVAVYKKLMEVTGNKPAVSQQLADSLIKAGEYSEAVSVVNELIKNAPGDRTSQILLGKAQIGLQKIPEAIKTFQEMITADGNDHEARFYLGMAYEEGGKYEEAVRVFSNLLDKVGADSEQAKANRPVFQQHLAADHMQLGDYEKAIAIYQDLAKNDARFKSQLLNAYRVSRQFSNALSLGKSLYEKDPNDIEMGKIYARTLADAGKPNEGIEVLANLLKSNPQSIDLYVNLSQVYLQDNRFADAEKIIRRAEERKLGDENGEMLKFQLATVYEKQKDFDRAESLFKEILKANPNNAVVLNYIGYMLADRGIRLDEAVQYVKEALTIDPNNGAYLDSLGWAFFKLNDLENAEKYLLEADNLIRNDPVIDDHLGDLYYKTGDFQKAEDFWMRSVSIGTEPEDIQKVQQKLEKLKQMLQKQKSGK